MTITLHRFSPTPGPGDLTQVDLAVLWGLLLDEELVETFFHDGSVRSLAEFMAYATAPGNWFHAARREGEFIGFGVINNFTSNGTAAFAHLCSFACGRPQRGVFSRQAASGDGSMLGHGPKSPLPAPEPCPPCLTGKSTPLPGVPERGESGEAERPSEAERHLHRETFMAFSINAKRRPAGPHSLTGREGAAQRSGGESAPRREQSNEPGIHSPAANAPGKTLRRDSECLTGSEAERHRKKSEPERHPFQDAGRIWFRLLRDSGGIDTLIAVLPGCYRGARRFTEAAGFQLRMTLPGALRLNRSKGDRVTDACVYQLNLHGVAPAAQDVGPGLSRQESDGCKQ